MAWPILAVVAAAVVRQMLTQHQVMVEKVS
jgi:hypothetical protein